MRTWTLGGFATPEALLDAARELRRRGHRAIETYSPFPLEGAEEALGLSGSRLPLFVSLGAATGAATGYLMQWYCNAVSFPINVGGRPPHSPPSFVPITFELAILFGAFGAFFGLLLLLRLPRLHHPVFEAPGFPRATVDRYWISIVTEAGDAGDATDGQRGADPLRDRLRDELTALGADEVTWVEERA